VKWIWATAVVVIAISAELHAETGKAMKGSKTGDNMNMTYTGCVETVNHSGSFLLTHVADPTMQNVAGMAKSDSARASKEMHAEPMMPGAMVLTGGLDLKKHVGQRVAVTGSRSHATPAAMPDGQDTLTVASLKVIAKSCS